MLKLHELKPYRKSVKRRKVVGRGFGSGHGTYSGRGAKGQKARSGSSIPAGFEGGRMPLHRQLPKKRGFTSRRQQATPVRLDYVVSKFNDKTTVNPKLLVQKGMIKSAQELVKIVGGSEFKKQLNFEKVLVTKAVRAKIEKAGGKILDAIPTVTKEESNA